jgi:hypothetical protein
MEANGDDWFADYMAWRESAQPQYSKFLWLALALIPLVAAWVYFTSAGRFAVVHQWQELHTWPLYDTHGCDAVRKGYLALQAGDRGHAMQQFREAQWQWDRGKLDYGSDDVRTVTSQLERGLDLATVASGVRNAPDLSRCARYG